MVTARSRHLVLLVSLLAAAAAGAGCRGDCHDELSVGGSYTAVVLGPYGPGTRFPGSDPFSPGIRPSCEGFDGLQEGAQVTIKATGTYVRGGCDAFRGTITEAPAAVVLVPSAQNQIRFRHRTGPRPLRTRPESNREPQAS
jgi:hypothetical protein